MRVAKKIFDETDDEVTITYDVVADDDFEDTIIPGILIKDAQGEAICGTNTEVLSQGKDKIVLRAGESIRTSWTVPKSFNEGKFFVEPAILSGSTRETLQWWDEAIAFRIINPESVPYPVALKIKFESKK